MVLGLFILPILLVPIPDPLFPDKTSTVVTDRQGQIMRVFLNPQQQRSEEHTSELQSH